MFRNIAFKILWNISYRIGFDLRDKNQPPTPLKTYGNDPRELPYLHDLPYATLNLPTVLGVGLRFYRLSGETDHPYIVAIKEALRSEDPEKCAIEILRKYSEMFNLESPNDFLGLNKNEEVFPNQSHPYEYTYPWSSFMPHELKKIILDYTYEENKRYGLLAWDSLDLPNASDEKIKIEAKRLITLFSSVKEQGYKQEYPDTLGCFILIDGNSWKWYVLGGQHRASVLAALGYEKIPVLVRRIIRREEVRFWPNVQSGIFTEQQALTVFDKLFAAEPPPVAKEWVKYVNHQFKNEIKMDQLRS